MPTLDSDTMWFVLIGAYRRAWAAGRANVGSDDMLAELAWRMSPPGTDGRLSRRQVLQSMVSARVRCETDGPAASTTAEPDDDQPSVRLDGELRACLREARWFADQRLRRLDDEKAPSWTPAAVAAVRGALAAAEAAGVAYAHEGHLLAALLAEKGTWAQEVLVDRGLSPEEVVRGSSLRRLDKSGSPRIAGAAVLLTSGALTTPRAWPLRLATAISRLNLFLRGFPSPAIAAVEWEGQQQAVRLGDRRVATVHLLIAVCALTQQLADAGWRLTEAAGYANAAGELLRKRGVTADSVVRLAAKLATDVDPVAARRYRRWRAVRACLPIGTDANAVIDRAVRLARARRHQPAGTSHLILAMADGSEPLATVLYEHGIDANELTADLELSLRDGA
jgi:hypothetical protein